MSPSQRGRENSVLGPLLPSLYGFVEALGEGHLPANLAPLYEFLDTELRPRIRIVGLRCRVLEPTHEHGSLITLLARDVSNMDWYAGRIENTLAALRSRNGSSVQSARLLGALFVRLLAAVELASTTEIEISRRPESNQVSVSRGVTARREEP
jgi:hypothetical protein